MIRALLPATVDLRVHLGDEPLMVRCDPAQVHQLVVNLCNNAFRALDAAGGHISVSLRHETVSGDRASRHPDLAPGDYAVLQISDTGHGMDAETMERACEPFFTTQDVGEGTGLGLSVVHGIVHRHGGDLQVTSEVGKGTDFRIYLPRASESNPES